MHIDTPLTQIINTQDEAKIAESKGRSLNQGWMRAWEKELELPEGEEIVSANEPNKGNEAFVSIFEEQDADYKESVLPSAVTARVAVEAGVPHIWKGYVGNNGKVIGMTTFGESAPIGDLLKLFGFTVDNVVAAVNEVMA